MLMLSCAFNSPVFIANVHKRPQTALQHVILAYGITSGSVTALNAMISRFM
jgi:hypothetical protein